MAPLTLTLQFLPPSSLLNLRTCTSLSQYHITLWCVRWWWCSKRRRMLIGSVPPVGLLLRGHSLITPSTSFIQSLSRSPHNVLAGISNGPSVRSLLISTAGDKFRRKGDLLRRARMKRTGRWRRRRPLLLYITWPPSWPRRLPRPPPCSPSSRRRHRRLRRLKMKEQGFRITRNRQSRSQIGTKTTISWKVHFPSPMLSLPAAPKTSCF